MCSLSFDWLCSWPMLFISCSTEFSSLSSFVFFFSWLFFLTMFFPVLLNDNLSNDFFISFAFINRTLRTDFIVVDFFRLAACRGFRNIFSFPIWGMLTDVVSAFRASWEWWCVGIFHLKKCFGFNPLSGGGLASAELTTDFISSRSSTMCFPMGNLQANEGDCRQRRSHLDNE